MQLISGNCLNVYTTMHAFQRDVLYIYSLTARAWKESISSMNSPFMHSIETWIWKRLNVYRVQLRHWYRLHVKGLKCNSVYTCTPSFVLWGDSEVCWVVREVYTQWAKGMHIDSLMYYTLQLLAVLHACVSFHLAVYTIHVSSSLYEVLEEPVIRSDD